MDHFKDLFNSFCRWKAEGKSTEKGKQSKGKDEEKAKKKQPLIEENQSGKTVFVISLEDYDEDSIQCFSCYGWPHEACADIPEYSNAYMWLVPDVTRCHLQGVCLFYVFEYINTETVILLIYSDLKVYVIYVVNKDIFFQKVFS